MGFVYRVVWVLKPCESFCLKPFIFLENCIKLTFSGCPRKFYHRVMYIAPSSGHIFPPLFAFAIDSNKVSGCFLMSGVRILHFLKEWWNFIQIHQYYTMALICTRLTMGTILRSVESYWPNSVHEGLYGSHTNKAYCGRLSWSVLGKVPCVSVEKKNNQETER